MCCSLKRSCILEIHGSGSVEPSNVGGVNLATMVGCWRVDGAAAAWIGPCDGGVGACCTDGQSACRGGRWADGVDGVVEGLTVRCPCEEEPGSDGSGAGSKLSATLPMICGVLED